MFKPIQKIHVTALRHIHRLERIGTGKDQLMVTHDIQEVPFKSGTARWSVATSQTAAGLQYAFTLSFTAARKIRWNGRPAVLVIEFCDGEKKIIGSPYLPVFPETTETQENESVTIRHVNKSFPRDVSISVI